MIFRPVTEFNIVSNFFFTALNFGGGEKSSIVSAVLSVLLRVYIGMCKYNIQACICKSMLRAYVHTPCTCTYQKRLVMCSFVNRLYIPRCVHLTQSQINMKAQTYQPFPTTFHHPLNFNLFSKSKISFEFITIV